MRQGNLPVQLSRFVGRREDVAELGRKVRAHRLVTLLGPVGIGKTRLALQLAEVLQQGFRDGAWLIEFPSTSPPGLLPDLVARPLGIATGDRTDPLARLSAALRGQQILLVLDNCEAVADGLAPIVDRLLRECPELTVVATSREPIRVSIEQQWRVPPLELPRATHTYSPERLGAMDSVALFVDRARQRDPGYGFDAASGADLAALVRFLDGVPLALELAAAWMGTLSPRELLVHLAEHPQDLVAAGPTGDPRHASLWTAIDSSYQSLDPSCQALLDQLGVFPGGWNRAAMTAVCIPATDAPLAALRQLIDRSFVTMQAAPDGPTRYRMLGVIRQYTQDRLSRTGGLDAVRGRFASFFADLATTAGAGMTTRQGPRHLQVLDVELDNVRGLLSMASVDPELRLRVVAALVPYWHLRGLLGEGCLHLETALRAAPRTLPGVAAAFNGLSRLAWAMGDMGLAARMGRQGFLAARRRDDQLGAAEALLRMAYPSFDSGCPASANTWAGHAQRLSAGIRDDRVAAACLLKLGEVALVDGRLDEADGMLTRAIALFSGVDQVDQEAIALLILGRVRLRQGRIEDAEAALIRSLSILRDFALPRPTVPIVESLAAVALERGDRRRAATLAGAGSGLLRRMGVRPPVTAPMRRNIIAGLQPLEGAPDTREAFAVGCAMELHEVIAYALGDPVRTAEAAPRSGPAAVGRLTAQQRKVAELVTEGQTNKEIAARLVVSERTVETHIRAILNKLGCSNRVQIAVQMTNRPSRRSTVGVTARYAEAANSS